MPEYSYDITLTWRGGRERGAEMERIVRAAFEESEGGGEAQALRKALTAFDADPIENYFDTVEYFGEYDLPHTMLMEAFQSRLYSDERDGCFKPIFDRFAELDYYVVFNFGSDEDEVFYHYWFKYEGGTITERDTDSIDPEDYDEWDEASAANDEYREKREADIKAWLKKGKK